ncbi:hypothetical protein LMG3458_02782 [Achromobacter deleyi]|uniref:Uncharacterized protein n=1 Tax=Achromobacter deleyi TaxID=1353891 RepID=A0A6S6ZYF1_9BURK|nr:hypothetical protein LMG3458_02782 [Achromobacter deleyi]CAB3857566.1 hypothetical protein LMG3482_02098 [Achromobacter deleyi]CAB3884680.1 hypothetical protein LMG3481_03442 [Achromobacter deleyi]
MIDLKTVYVTAYTRWRFGREESVCAHWRSHPGSVQLLLL